MILLIDDNLFFTFSTERIRFSLFKPVATTTGSFNPKTLIISSLTAIVAVAVYAAMTGL